MRQMKDYYFQLKYSNTIDCVVVRNCLEQLGLSKFCSGLRCVMDSIFGLPRDLMIIEPNNAYGDIILKSVMDSGNFGIMSDNNVHKMVFLNCVIYKLREILNTINLIIAHGFGSLADL